MISILPGHEYPTRLLQPELTAPNPGPEDSASSRACTMVDGVGAWWCPDPYCPMC